jgi:hypothetical protein
VNSDTAPLARLLARAESGESEPESPSESFDTPLYYATSCEEEQFPWNRSSSPRGRLTEAKGRIAKLAPSSIAPFTAANVLDFSDIGACAFWPFATPAPAIQDAPLPAVPTLILSGADDLRTPTANAREVAAKIVGSHLLVVPNVGHSVLGTDPSSCSHVALLALFAPTAIKPCRPAPPSPLLRVVPLAPKRLSDVSPAYGTHGRPGRTLQAIALTLADFNRQLALQELTQLESGNLAAATLDVGGLRAGWAAFAAGKLALHAFSYVPGVTVSGEIGAEIVQLSVGGTAAAHGTLRLGPDRSLTGVLGGQRVRLADGRSGGLGAVLKEASATQIGATAELARLRAEFGR